MSLESFPGRQKPTPQEELQQNFQQRYEFEGGLFETTVVSIPPVSDLVYVMDGKFESSKYQGSSEDHLCGILYNLDFTERLVRTTWCVSHLPDHEILFGAMVQAGLPRERVLAAIAGHRFPGWPDTAGLLHVRIDFLPKHLSCFAWARSGDYFREEELRTRMTEKAKLLVQGSCQPLLRANRRVPDVNLDFKMECWFTTDIGDWIIV